MSITGTFWQDRSVFVTGATGHLGGWLVRRLVEASADVVCLVRDCPPECDFIRTGLVDQVKVVNGDLIDPELMKRIIAEHHVDTVFHLAAQCIVSTANHDPISTFDTNIRGTWTLLDAIRLTSSVRQVVVASTDKVYGESARLPYVEDMPLLAVYPHDVSKACAEMVAGSYVATYGLNLAFTRLPNVYGGGDLNWSRIIPGTIRSILQHKQPVINSNGTYIRDYLYVEEAIAAHLALAEQLADNPDLRGQAFNISSETYMTVLQVVDHLLNIMGSSLQPVVRDQARNEIKHQYLSAAKARQMLGWQPEFTTEEGLQRTIDWYREYLGS